MVFSAIMRALKVIAKKPFKLWGISLLSGVLTSVGSMLFGVIPGVALAISLLISTSMTMVFLHGLRGEDVKVVQLFDCFKDWQTIKRVLGGMAWMALWIFLWSLIPIVGFVFAIIKSYQYMLVPYILVHEQNVPLTEAIHISEQRMKGSKRYVFLAELLSIGAIVAAIIVLSVLAAIPFIGVIFGFVLFLVILAVAIFASLFFGLLRASFYELINEKNNG